MSAHPDLPPPPRHETVTHGAATAAADATPACVTAADNERQSAVKADRDRNDKALQSLACSDVVTDSAGQVFDPKKAWDRGDEFASTSPPAIAQIRDAGGPDRPDRGGMPAAAAGARAGGRAPGDASGVAGAGVGAGPAAVGETVGRSTRQIVISYGCSPALIFRAAAMVFGYSCGACRENDALALITIGTETGTLDDADALAKAYRAAIARATGAA